MKKKLLIIAATHGNEPLGVDLCRALEKQGFGQYFDWLIANPKALAKRKEYLDANLNRSYPGKKNSRLYEERRAYKNLQIAKKYRYVIDIHEASEGKNDFIIIPRKKIGRFPISWINLKNVLLWPDPKGPIGDVLDTTAEIEFGAKKRSRRELLATAINLLTNFISCAYGLNGKIAKKQVVFLVYGKLMKTKTNVDPNKIIDFKRITIKNEAFYPLLTNQYLRHNIICYKMKKVNEFFPMFQRSRRLK